MSNLDHGKAKRLGGKYKSKSRIPPPFAAKDRSKIARPVQRKPSDSLGWIGDQP